MWRTLATTGPRCVGQHCRRLHSIAALGDRLAKVGIQVVTTRARLQAKSRDYYWFSPVLRGRLNNKLADAYVVPKSEAEVVEILRECHALGVAVTVRGAGTGNYGQAVPLHGGLVLDTSRLDYCSFANGSPDAGVVNAGSGAVMGNIERELLKPAGWEFRMHPSTLSSATIGGFICGGSGGIGSVNYGVLKDPGNILSLRIVTMEAEPRILDLDPLDSAAVSHAYGTNGVVTQVTLPLAPSLEWHEALVGFPNLASAAAFGLSLAEAPGIAKKQVGILASPIPELYLEKRLAKPSSRQQRIQPEELQQHGAVAVVMVGEHSLDAMADLAASNGHNGKVLWSEGMADAARSGRHPLYETCWNHTTLHAMRLSEKGEEITYLQTGFAPSNNLLDTIQRVHDTFSHRNELMTHLEFVNLGGRVGAFGIPLLKFSSEKRLQDIIATLESPQFGLGVFNPHTYVLEDGGMKQTDQQQLEFKRLVDPDGLMNPGKMRAFEQGRANYDGTAGFDKIRVGTAAKHPAGTFDVATVMGDDLFTAPLQEVALDDEMLEVLCKGEDEDDFVGLAPGGQDTREDQRSAMHKQAQNPTTIVGVKGTLDPDPLMHRDRGCRFPTGHLTSNNWSDLTTTEFAARSADTARAAASVAVLPVGAIEQHGAHLPVGVDTIHAHAAVTGALQLLPELVAEAISEGADIDVGDIRILPTQAIGTSLEHQQFEGTLSLSASTLIDIVMQIGASVQRAGFSKFVLVNSHGGQIAPLAIAARRLRIEYSILAIVHNGFASWPVKGLWPEDECRFGIHGGGIETSVMLHLNPELVQMDQAVRAKSTAVDHAEEHLQQVLFPHNADTSYGWMTQDLHESGVVGDATDADEERGKVVMEAAAERLARLLVEVSAADKDELIRNRGSE